MFKKRKKKQKTRKERVVGWGGDRENTQKNNVSCNISLPVFKIRKLSLFITRHVHPVSMCLCRPSERQEKKVLNINWTWAKLVFDNQYLFFDFTTDKLIIFPQFLLCHYVAYKLIHLYVWCFVNKSSFSFSISFRLVIAIYLCFLLNPITATTE